MKIFASVVFLCVTQWAWCEERVLFGPHVMIHRLDELGSITGWNFGMGARVLVPVQTFHVQVSGNYFFISTPEGFSYDWNLYDGDIDLLYPIGSSSVRPYVGGGLNLSRFTADCKTGGFCDPATFKSGDVSFGIIGGVRFLTGGEVTPVFEARYIFDTEIGEFPVDRLVLSAGILF